MNTEKRLWYEADYFSKFACKCGDCRHACCKGWKIAVSENEYFRLIGLECSEKLHEKLESAFCIPDFPTTGRYRMIEPDWLGQCHMLDTDGLCMLQKECGEGVLPEVCRVYPRSYKNENGNLQACCSSSCERVVEMLMEEDRLRFVYQKLTAEAEINEEVAADYSELGRKTIDILQDRSITLRERMLKICSESGYRPEADISIKAVIDIIGRLLEESDTLKEYAGEIFRLNEFSEGEIREKYFADRILFEKNYPEWSRYFENILCNNILYSDFPCTDRRISESESCSGLCLQFILMKFICAMYTHDKPDKNAFVDCVSGVYHLVEHTSFYYNAHILVKNPPDLLWL